MNAPESIDVTAVLSLADQCPDLADILEQYGKELRDHGVRYEFVIVLDGVGEAMERELAARIPPGEPARLVLFNQPFGEERAQASAYREARGRMIVSLPAYMQLDPGGIHGVLDALESRYDLVVGWRSPRVDPAINRVQSWLYNTAMRTLTGARFHDLNSGLVGLRRSVLYEVLSEGDASRFLPVLAFRRGFRVGEVKIRHLSERGRQGFFGLRVYIRRFLDVVALLFITKFTRKPLRFFGAAGIASFLLGAAICLSILVDYMVRGTPGSEPRNQAGLITGWALIVLGVMVFSLGLVAEIIIFTNARHLQEYAVERERAPGLASDESVARAVPAETVAARAPRQTGTEA